MGEYLQSYKIGFCSEAECEDFFYSVIAQCEMLSVQPPLRSPNRFR